MKKLLLLTVFICSGALGMELLIPANFQGNPDHEIEVVALEDNSSEGAPDFQANADDADPLNLAPDSERGEVCAEEVILVIKDKTVADSIYLQRKGRGSKKKNKKNEVAKKYVELLTSLKNYAQSRKVKEYYWDEHFRDPTCYDVSGEAVYTISLKEGLVSKNKLRKLLGKYDVENEEVETSISYYCVKDEERIIRQAGYKWIHRNWQQGYRFGIFAGMVAGVSLCVAFESMMKGFFEIDII